MVHGTANDRREEEMGDMAEYYDERTDDDTYERHPGFRRPRRRRHVPPSPSGRHVAELKDVPATHCHPRSDEDAQALIESLGTYAWETRKVSGRYTTEPYTLHATIDGHAYVIHLPGARGTTLSWLKRKVGAA